MQMEMVSAYGWDACARLTNGSMELLITTQVGPRIIHCGFCGGQNLFATLENELGGCGEDVFKLRGGHRFWIAPEDMTLTYELDNHPVTVEPLADGVHLKQDIGSISGCQKEVIVQMAADADRVRIVHRLTNQGQTSRRLAPWALSVMAPGGVAVIPLPPKIPHTEAWLHNQLWTVWPYTDLADGRWTIGKEFLLFRQDVTKGPGKIGVMHREDWVAYQLGSDLFVKRFTFDPEATYPDGGVNFETFSNEEILELESLGGLVDLAPGACVEHVEQWELHKDTSPVTDEASAKTLPPAQNG